MLNNLKKKTEGFTIIEVLIVLAIAGLILLIVFLAVPALQRNSRNNGRKNDISRIAAGVNEFVSNNNGTLPTNVQTGTIAGTNVGNLNQYAPADAPAGDRNANAAGAQAVQGTVAGRTFFRLVTGAQCGADGATVAGSARQAAIQYQIESSSAANPTQLCQNI